MSSLTAQGASLPDVPLPIVQLNRWTLVIGITLGFVLHQPLMTTALFVVLAAATIFGQRGSLIFQVGKRLFGPRLATAPREDRGLVRFNNAIATMLLGLAQAAFALGLPAAGWALAGLVVVAAGVALAGFCLGCFLYYQFKLNRYRVLRGR
jgi:hypothetical protein